MAKKAIPITINLLPKDPFFETLIGKTLRWALSIGRYIVIFTELVVIISFATRFTLDRQVTDLNDRIHQKETIIKSYGELEDQVRATQMKIDQIKQINQSDSIIEVFPKLSSITPKEIRLKELTLHNDSVNFHGTTLSQTALNNLINNLQLTPEFKNVSIDRIETNQKTEGGFVFSVSFDLTTPTDTNKVKKAITNPVQN